ncbi:MAG: hypothetical protein ACKVT2_11735 [Saprospiraceae bacterium]
MKALSIFAWLRFGAFVVCFSIFFGCNDCKVPPQSHSPILLIIGEDLSGTFEGYYPLTELHLERSCEAIQNHVLGGTIVLCGIGLPDNMGWEMCALEPIKIASDDIAVGKKIKIKTENKSIISKNASEIRAFIEKAKIILNKKNQDSTHINGFFEKMSTLASQQKYDGYKKILFVNSDGKQDSGQNKIVDCRLKPECDFFICGWKKKPDCSPIDSYPSPEEFVSDLQRLFLKL